MVLSCQTVSRDAARLVHVSFALNDAELVHQGARLRDLPLRHQPFEAGLERLTEMPGIFFSEADIVKESQVFKFATEEWRPGGQ